MHVFKAVFKHYFREEERKTLDWSTFQKTLQGLESRLFSVEQDASKYVQAVSFLEDLEQYFIERYLKRDMDRSSRSLVESAMVHIKRGLQFYYKGDYENAISEYELVTSLLPRFPLGYVRLGSLHYQQGRFTEAITHWKKARALGPDDMILQRVVDQFLERVNADMGPSTINAE